MGGELHAGVGGEHVAVRDDGVGELAGVVDEGGVVVDEGDGEGAVGGADVAELSIIFFCRKVECNIDDKATPKQRNHPRHRPSNPDRCEKKLNEARHGHIHKGETDRVNCRIGVAGDSHSLVAVSSPNSFVQLDRSPLVKRFIYTGGGYWCRWLVACLFVVCACACFHRPAASAAYNRRQ